MKNIKNKLVAQISILSIFLNLFYPLLIIGEVSANSSNEKVIEKNNDFKTKEEVYNFTNKITKTSQNTKGLKYVEGEVLVKYKDSKNSSKSKKAFLESKGNELKNKGLSITKSFDKLGINHIKGSGKTTKKLIEELKNDSDIEYIQPNFIYENASTPNDTNFTNLWGLDNNGQYIEYSFGTMDVDFDWPEAMDEFTGANDGTGVIVAVIDTGVDYTHPDLVNKMWDGTNCVDTNGNTLGNCTHGYDFNSFDNDPFPTSSDHGTHVAGTIAAEMNNNNGIVGVNPNAKIMAIKGFETSSNAINSINFAKENGARIINASWGGYFLSSHDCNNTGLTPDIDQAMYNAIKDFGTAGGLFIAAAGNYTMDHTNPSTRMFPSGYGTDFECSGQSFSGLDNIISVAAVDNTGNIANFSDFGSSSVHIGAPGVSVYSTVLDSSSTTSIISTEYFEGESTGAYIPTWLTGSLGNWGISDIITDGILGDNKFYGDYNSPYSTGQNNSLETNSIDLSIYDDVIINFDFECDFPENETGDYLNISLSNNGGINYYDVLRLDGTASNATANYGSGKYWGYLKGYLSESFLVNDFKFKLDWVTDDDNETDIGCGLDSFYLKGYNNIENQFGYKDGTSMAAPHISGLASYAWSNKQDKSYLEIKNAILNSGVDLSSLNGKTITGKMANLYNTLDYLNSPEINDFSFLTGTITNSTGVSVQIVSNEYPVTYTLTGDLVSSYTGTLNSTGSINVELNSGDGEKEINLVLKDSYDNLSDLSSIFINLDQTAPVVNILSDTSTGVSSKNFTFTFNSSDTDISTGSILWSNNLNSNTGSDLTYLVDSETSDNLEVTVSYEDILGNSGTSTLTGFIIDNTAPNDLNYISLNENNIINISNLDNIELYGTGNISDSGSVVEYYIKDNILSLTGNTILAGTSFSFSGFDINSLNDGTIEFGAKLKDEAGNESNYLSGTVQKETQAASGLVSFLTGTITNSTGVLVQIVSNEYPVTYTLTGDLVSSYTGTLNSTGSINVELNSGDGEKEINLILEDSGNNISSLVSSSILLDQTNPIINFNSYSNNEQVALENISLTGTFSDSNSISSLEINGTGLIIDSGEFNINIDLIGGDNQIEYSLIDEAGNTNSGYLNIVRISEVDNIFSYVEGTGSALIEFSSDLVGTGEVLYGTGENSLNMSVLGNSLSLNHSINLTGLNEDTNYYFKVRTISNSYTGVLSEISSFKTSNVELIDDLCTNESTFSGSLIFGGNGFTSTGITSSCSGSINLVNGDNSVNLSLSGLVIETDNWDGLFLAPEQRTFSGSFSHTGFLHRSSLTYNIGHNQRELVLSGVLAEVKIKVGTSFNGKKLGVFRSDDNGNSYNKIDECIVVNGDCNFKTGQFSYFTFGEEEDSIPDSFSFTDKSSAALSTIYTSNSITVSGINISTGISISNGTYSINGGTFTGADLSISDGDTVEVKLSSSSSYSTTVSSVLTIGGISDTFSITTISKPSSGGGGGGGGGSYTPTCKIEQLECLAVGNIYKWYRKSGESCTNGDLGKECSFEDLVEDNDENTEEVSNENKEENDIKVGLPLKILNKLIVLKTDKNIEIRNKYQSYFENIDNDLTNLSYLNTNLIGLRTELREEYKKWLLGLKDIEEFIENDDLDSANKAKQDVLFTFRKIKNIEKEESDLISKYGEIKVKKIGNIEISYIKFSDKKVSNLSDKIIKYISKKEDNEELFKITNKLLLIVDDLLNNKELSREEKIELKNEGKGIYIEFLSKYKSLDLKKEEEKVELVVNNEKEEKQQEINNDIYKIKTFSLKLYLDTNFKYLTAWLKAGDEVEILEKVNNYGLLKVRITKSYAERYVGKEGYIYEKHLEK